MWKHVFTLSYFYMVRWSDLAFHSLGNGIHITKLNDVNHSITCLPLYYRWALFSFATAFNQSWKVAYRKLEWKVERSKHNGAKNPPSGHRGNKEACTASLQHELADGILIGKITHLKKIFCSCSSARIGHVVVLQRQIPISSRNTRKSKDERKKNNEKHDIRTKWTYEKNHTDYGYNCLSSWPESFKGLTNPWTEGRMRSLNWRQGIEVQAGFLNSPLP